MSIEFNGDTVIVTGTLEKLSTFASKGGGINLSVQAGDDPKTSSTLIANRGKIAKITFEFSSTRASEKKRGKGDGDFDFEGDKGGGDKPKTPEPGKASSGGKKGGKKAGVEGDQETLT